VFDGVSQSETRTLTNRLRDELFKTGVYIVLERGKMDEVLKEQGFQQTGCITSECAVDVRRMLGVQQMVAGSIGKVGTVYTVSARIFDVETGKILQSANYDHIGDIGQLLLKGIRAVVQQLITGKSSNNQVEISTPTRVADTGNADERQEITERWPSGLKKTVVIYKGTGINETIEKLGFREDGQPAYKTNPATDWIYKSLQIPFFHFCYNGIYISNLLQDSFYKQVDRLL
jgi:TolB-like protein